MQPFACLEGPVSEEYDNALVTINKPECPIQPTTQSLVNKAIYNLIISEKNGEQVNVKVCASFVFISTPIIQPGIESPISVELLSDIEAKSICFSDTNGETMYEGSPKDLPDNGTLVCHHRHPYLVMRGE